jgi:hypothetical protein
MCVWRTFAVLLFGLMSGATWAQSDVRSFIVTPAGATFAASLDPDATVAPVSSTAQWYIRNGNIFQNWTLRFHANSATVINCPKVPLSAFRVACVSVTSPVLGSGNCVAGSMPVTTSPQTLASGMLLLLSGTYTAGLRIEFTDSWRYPAALAAGCSLSLSYIVDAP